MTTGAEAEPLPNVAPEEKKPATAAEALLANSGAKEPSTVEAVTADDASVAAPVALAPPGPVEPSNGAASAPVEPKAVGDAPAASTADNEKPAVAAAPAKPNVKAATPTVADARLPFKMVADSCVMQGRRPKQEDRHVKVPDLTKAARALKMPIDHLEQPCAFFAVYDGHQGHLCAEYVAKNFHMRLLKRLSADTNGAAWTDDRLCRTFREICEELDNEFLAKFRTAIDGCTVVTVLISGTRCIVAWVGDSRCLLGRRTSKDTLAAVALTEDHRPSIPSEADRVKKAGGIVVDLGYASRVAHEGYEERIREIRRAQAQGLGTIGKEPVALAVSRALGDREFKAVTGKALLVPTPDVRCIRLERSHLFIALMCDGISDVMSNDDVIEELGTTRDSADSVADVRAACGALVQEAYKKNSQDNLTVIMVRLEWTGASPGDHITKRRPVEAAVDASAQAMSKRRRLQAQTAVSAQKVAAHHRLTAGADVVMTPAPLSPPKVVPVTEPGAPEASSEKSTEPASAPATAVAQAPAAASAAPAAAETSKPCNGNSKEEEVVVVGHSRADMNGSRGVVIKTISDGRRVVRLTDGRELAFKPENLQPAGSAPATAASAGGAKASTAPAPAPQPPAAAKVDGGSGGEEVVLHGLPRADLNGQRGVVVKTISDGRRVVRLGDGRELAFKPENMRPAGSAEKPGAAGNQRPAGTGEGAVAPGGGKDAKQAPTAASAPILAAKIAPGPQQAPQPAPAVKVQQADAAAKKPPPKDEAKKPKPQFTFV